jgi:hypothetical protein
MSGIQQIFRTRLTPPLDSTQNAHIGEIIYDDGNRYEYCKFTEEGGGGETLTAGDAVFSNMLTTNDYHLNHFEAAGSVTINDLRGIFIGDGHVPWTIDDTTILDGDFGWVQTWGYQASINMEGTTDITAGDSLKAVSGQHYMVKDQARGTAASYVKHCVSQAAYTTNSAATKPGYVRCQA